MNQSDGSRSAESGCNHQNTFFFRPPLKKKCLKTPTTLENNPVQIQPPCCQEMASARQAKQWLHRRVGTRWPITSWKKSGKGRGKAEPQRWRYGFKGTCGRGLHDDVQKNHVTETLLQLPLHTAAGFFYSGWFLSHRCWFSHSFLLASLASMSGCGVIKGGGASWRTGKPWS